MTLIHTSYSFPQNVTKIPTPAIISLYLQIINIQNVTLKPWLIINMYMSSHEEDLSLLPEIQNTIRHHITLNNNHNIILLGDFNKDIALIDRQHNGIHIPPSETDFQWRTFTNTLQLSYIPTNSQYSRQGGENYTQTSLIDGFYLKLEQLNRYHSHITTENNFNSDHFPIHLHIPDNSLLSRPHHTPLPPQRRILNPIPPYNIEKFKTQFYETNSQNMDNLILLLQQEQLTALQWTNTCNKLDTLTDNISSIIQNTCTTYPIQPLTQRTMHQGGYLPIKLQKQWKKHLSTYHLIRKAIYISQNTPNWTTHPLILQLHTYPHTQIPPPPNDAQLLNGWIQQLSVLAKTANKNARAITTKYTRQCVRKSISKYRRLYEISPKKINKIVFKNSETPPLDSLTNRQHNISQILMI
jgi:hypothetical protein